MSPRDIVPGDIAKKIMPDVIQKLLKDGHATFESAHRRKDGSIYPIEVSTHTFRYKGKDVDLSIVRDITERKRAEEELKESEGRFHALFERHDSVMLLIDPKTGKIIDANHAAERFYGRSQKELCTQSINEINILSPEDIADEIKKAALEKNNFFTFPHRLASGEIRTVEVHSSPIEMEGKTLLFSIINDVTERKVAEEALRVSNAFLDSVIDNIPVLVFLKDARELRFVRINRAVEELTGYSRSDLMGKNDYNFVPKEQADFFVGKDRQVLKRKEIVDIPEEPLQTRNKGMRTLHT